MHITFDPDKVDWSDFLSRTSISTAQSGCGFQTGYGSYFIGMPYQRGMGIGSIFKSLYRFLQPYGKSLLPLATNVGSAVKQEGLATAGRLINNVLGGENLSNALKRETRKGVGNLVSKAHDHFQNGGGKRKARSKAIKANKNTPNVVLTSLVGPKPKKSKLRVDSLGYY